STYLGASGIHGTGGSLGTGADVGVGVAVDAGGTAYVTGYTNASDFPTADPIQSYGGGPSDTFVARLNSAGTGLLFSTFAGGAGGDVGRGVGLAAAANIYVSGYTSSTNFPGGGTYQGGVDAFVAKIGPLPPAPVSRAATPDTGLFNDDRVTSAS